MKPHTTIDGIIAGAKHWDGTESLAFCFDDGGRAAAGFTGPARDCVARSIAIAAELPYAKVYKALAKGMGAQRGSMGASARNGVTTTRVWFKRYMASLGFTWVPTMQVGSGCKVHLLRGEIPDTGRLVVAVSKHYTAVINGVIHDAFNPSRTVIYQDEQGRRMTHRCVYGYWVKQ